MLLRSQLFEDQMMSMTHGNLSAAICILIAHYNYMLTGLPLLFCVRKKLYPDIIRILDLTVNGCTVLI